MKKFFAIFLIALLAMCMFVSCDDDDDETNYVNITYVFEEGGTFYASMSGKFNDGTTSITISDSISGTYVATDDTSGSYTYTDLDDIDNTEYYEISGNTLNIYDYDEELLYTLTRSGSGTGIVGTWKVKLTNINYD